MEFPAREEQCTNRMNKELLNLTEVQLKQLEEQVRVAGGVVWVMMHPLYRGTDPGEDAALVRYNEDFKRMIASVGSKTVPVIICEDRFGMKEIQEELEKIVPEAGRDRFYFVRTRDSSPEPEATNNSLPEEERRTDSWGRLNGVLKKAGVRTCIVGGQDFEIVRGVAEPSQQAIRDQMEVHGWNVSDVSLGWCVGETAVRIARDIPVEIGPIAYPHSRKDLVRGGTVTKG